MRDEIGLGTIATFPAYARSGRNNKPAVAWRINAKADCLALVEILDEYPLWSKKAAEYAVWREAVIAWQLLERRGRARLDWTEIAEHFDTLRALRVYRGGAA